jgi:hypothetical protein
MAMECILFLASYMTARTVRSASSYLEPPSTPWYKIFLYIVGIALIGWGLVAGIQHISTAHAQKVASQEQRDDQTAIDRVNERHLIPSPTPQVIQDPALVQKVDDLTKEVQGLK